MGIEMLYLAAGFFRFIMGTSSTKSYWWQKFFLTRRAFIHGHVKCFFTGETPTLKIFFLYPVAPEFTE